MSERPYTAKGLARRGRKLMFAGLVALATVVYLVGLRAGVPQRIPTTGEAAPTITVSEAAGSPIPSLTYSDVGSYALRPEAKDLPWAHRMRGLRAPPHDPITSMDARKASLARRTERRAFNGAPPSIPHPIGALTAHGCVACHGQGVSLEGHTARGLPHPFYASCTQCHVEAAPAALVEASAPDPESTWLGAAAPLEGTRAWPGAPPSVPHSIQMRTSCVACHGVHGWPGMQTSHPGRTSCLQCHALSADELPGLRVRASAPHVTNEGNGK